VDARGFDWIGFTKIELTAIYNMDLRRPPEVLGDERKD